VLTLLLSPIISSSGCPQNFLRLKCLLAPELPLGMRLLVSSVADPHVRIKQGQLLSFCHPSARSEYPLRFSRST
jgi:hypothetical protein